LPVVETKMKLELQDSYISNRNQSMIKTLNGVIRWRKACVNEWQIGNC